MLSPQTPFMRGTSKEKSVEDEMPPLIMKKVHHFHLHATYREM